MARKYPVGIDFDTIGNTVQSRTPTRSHVKSRKFLRQKLLDRTRKQLIEELIRVGRLIDPAPGTGQRKDEDAKERPSITEQSGMDAGSPVTGLEGLPVVDDVVDQPYTTKDMFTAPVDSYEPTLARPLERQRTAANTPGSNDAPVSEHIGHVATYPEKQLSQEATAIGFPVEELARELVTLIEDRVSQRSGEQLDDTFRDELTQAVIAKLEGWLEYD